MAKGGVTKKLEDTVKALDDNQLKKALYLTENNPKLDRHHQWIEEAARTCLSNKDDKEACASAIKVARDRVQETITTPMEDNSFDGLEGYLSNGPVAEPVQPVQHKSDDELYESCEECHVAVAASRFANACADYPEEAGSCELIGRSLDNENTEPVDWLKAMVQTAEEATGQAKVEMVSALTELTDYLGDRNSPLLKALDKE